MMRNQMSTDLMRITRKFQLEISEGGKAIIKLDDEVIPGITSFYVNNDAGEQLSIELWKADEQGNVDIMNVMVPL